MRILALSAIAVTSLCFANGPTHATAGKIVTITVDDGFKPEVVKTKVGVPLTILFKTKHRACATSVNFKELHLSKALKDGTTTVVTFTPKKPGTIHFACPMKMLRGSIVVTK